MITISFSVHVKLSYPLYLMEADNFFGIQTVRKPTVQFIQLVNVQPESLVELLWLDNEAQHQYLPYGRFELGSYQLVAVHIC